MGSTALETVRVLIVDDQVFFTQMLSSTLKDEAGIEVVGVAHDGDTAIRLAREKAPDAVLMDIELSGGLNGIEAGKRIKKERPQTGIVILSLHNDRRYVTSLPLEESPGWSYLLKQSVPDIEMVVHAIKGSIAGWPVVDPAVMANLRPRQGSVLAELTPSLMRVLTLITQGYSNAAIAERLNLTERTVEAYISTIYQRLGISSERDVHARVKATLIYLRDSQDGS